jgi:hypothetical protein
MNAESCDAQAAILIARWTDCGPPGQPANDNESEAMRRIDALFTERPFFGAQRIAKTLSEDGFAIDRKRVRRLMGIEALGPKPRTSKPAPGHKIYPYLLRGLSIARPNQVWAADITYIPIGKGFLYLVAIIDWHRLGEPGRIVLAAFEYSRRFVLRRGAREGVGAPGRAGNLQHRPGQPVHGSGFHRRAGHVVEPDFRSIDDAVRFPALVGSAPSRPPQ